MAAELKKSLGIEPDMIESSGGVFEIELNGELLFSKKKLDRFPEEGEIEKIIQQKLTNQSGAPIQPAKV